MSTYLRGGGKNGQRRQSESVAGGAVAGGAVAGGEGGGGRRGGGRRGREWEVGLIARCACKGHRGDHTRQHAHTHVVVAGAISAFTNASLEPSAEETDEKDTKCPPECVKEQKSRAATAKVLRVVALGKKESVRWAGRGKRGGKWVRGVGASGQGRQSEGPSRREGWRVVGTATPFPQRGAPGTDPHQCKRRAGEINLLSVIIPTPVRHDVEKRRWRTAGGTR
jgi:hypothetical protein